jgi:hypothetical protein
VPESLNPIAVEHLPWFVTAPGETDTLMVVTAMILAVSVVGFGVLFLRLHTLPERVAHKGQKVQFEIVAILGLLALFTHMHIFWVAGLMLAFIDIPDFGTFLGRIAGSVERLAGLKPGAGADGVPDDSATRPSMMEAAPGSRDGGETSTAKKPIRTVAGHKELDHA